jgi:hypothetical protein
MTEVSLFVWVITFDLSGMGGLTISYATSIAFDMQTPPQHQSKDTYMVTILFNKSPSQHFSAGSFLNLMVMKKLVFLMSSRCSKLPVPEFSNTFCR